MSSHEKIVVFDEDGNPKELRYYEAEKLVARLGTILDGDKNFIGLRELDIEEVSPLSWFDKLRRKPQPKHIDILTVDFIGLINWINTIKTIKTIENIDVVKAITNIVNIASLDLIDRITLIDAITTIASITNIGNIDRIGRIDSIEAKMNPIRNSAFLTDFTGWLNMDSSKITIETDADLGKRVRFESAGGYLQQHFFVSSDKFKTVAFRAYKPAVGGSNIRLWISYSDASATMYEPVLTNAWAKYTKVADAGKIICSISFIDLGGICFLALPQLVESTDVAQATRTNLLVKPEREDLLLKDVDFSASASLQSYLAAVESQKHKVYAFGYEADADGVYYFSATIGGSAFKFGRRITKGVYAQTFVHPVVCDVNTVLNFMSTTGNSKAWIQYKTEA
jgi:hypothetical protein